MPQWQKRKGFLHPIVIDDKKWIYYDNPKRRKSWIKSMYQHPRQSQISMPPSLCSVFDGISRVSHTMSCSNLTEPL